MHARTRVHEAVENAVREASELAGRSGAEERLRILVDGWGRGLAAGLEELAVAVDELYRLVAPGGAGQEKLPSPTGEDEEQLRARAAASRAETQALRDETP